MYHALPRMLLQLADGKKTRRLQDGNVVPTMNLPVGSCDKKVDASRKERDEDRASRRKRRGAISRYT